jgi:DNA processing protein
MTEEALPPVRVIRRDDPEYPHRLAAIEDAPDSLYVAGGTLSALPHCVAVVGARSATAYGLEMSRRIAGDLAAAGLCVVSGMARGIDSKAHEGALDAGGRTLAVLATDPASAYPPGMNRLHRRIVRAGAVISEHPAGTYNQKHLFIARNRIIAGMSIAVVVVQGIAGRSGALKTAGFALDYGREVFAVPGDARSQLSSGPHQLARTGARIVTSGAEILEDLKLLSWFGSSYVQPRVDDMLEGEDATVAQAVAIEPARAETLAVRSGLSAVVVLRVLARLERKGIVAAGPGGVFYRAR